MQKLTHVVWAYVISVAFGLNPVGVIFGALVPDLDYRFKHRKFLHNMFSIILITLFSGPLWKSVLVGLVSHILLDMLTVSGVSLLYPLSERRFRIAPFRTGGFFDQILLVVGLGLALLLTSQEVAEVRNSLKELVKEAEGYLGQVV